ncbi:MAG: threonine synthase [Nitrospirae bacterium CG18_big_fil_WC_8_21_14_2_50_70_55]|nr:threonine synthase [Deltaproteobacteria bacterium]OIP66440.1 MAG: threonine synthase [Nitrospirae bacterium CG2_30_70_394]PIQ05701.1 MAG: threonine synthase [Nitrospirae bacterium CG18_big_fil_WC_8_21_14_2_50_70_55]PIU79514.1 MAG: threonine synthase [Nitrospirae bacterium CG06_land_8_20_14_3_00_70_43]PIW83814.1 MAG: threonine synthase [Nitrospirae bacterium CG_4_8_14_3_um_filter_70_85]PIX82205.1 MAG: threonine synthase [Nitrospirae bacterium CG_4_10_14_3_um_filter_70_108]PJB96583.1 MAG: th
MSTLSASKWPGIIRTYGEFFSVSEKTPVVTLQEGNTPLIEAPRLAAWLGAEVELYLKYDGANPTGSFKDRGMTMAVSKAREAGSAAVICASTGNTSASAAAYAAHAGIRAVVLIPEGKIALGKLAQAMIHGAEVVQIDGNFDDALTIVRQLAEAQPITLVNSINPFRIEGQMSAAFEICDQLGGRPPVYHFLPVGNAGNITAYWRGYRAYQKAGRIDRLPVMMGFQAAGAAPIVLGHRVDHPETIATAIRIGNPASWKFAEAARDESGGRIDMVTDTEILAAQGKIAALEGVFCEPASAASVAGLKKAIAAGWVKSETTIVCTLTGHGLKDPDTAIANAPAPSKAPATLAGVSKVLGL